MTKRKQLGDFYRGAYVKRTSYGIGGSIHRVYGRVTRIDLEGQKIVWAPTGGKGTRYITQFPPPAKNEPSSWKLTVIAWKDIPELTRNEWF